MEENYRNRKAELSDAASVKRLLEELENREFDQGIFDCIYAEYLHTPLTLMQVAVHGEDEIVGFISCKGQSLLHHEGLVFDRVQGVLVLQLGGEQLEKLGLAHVLVGGFVGGLGRFGHVFVALDAGQVVGDCGCHGSGPISCG